MTHRVLAIPLFLLTMLVMFAVTFGPFGSWLSDGVGRGMDAFGVWLGGAMTAAGAPAVLVSLVRDGIVAGVGGVLTFLPQIALLFLFLSLLEDSGYMSRAAFIMDRLLRRFGLSGKAFIPMLMGFGCTVPAIMGARTMENEKDRRMTILLLPFMSCSAKLPVYGLLSSAFFGPWAGLVVFALYCVGMAMGILSGLLFKHTLFAGEPAPFVLELPPYRLPSFSNVMRHVWLKVKGFLVKAGTLILLMSIVLWLLQSFDFSLTMVDDPARSMLGAIGAAIAPVFAALRLRRVAGGGGPAHRADRQGDAGHLSVHVLRLPPHRHGGYGGRRHGGLCPPVRLLLSGVHPAVCALRGRRVHPVPGDEQQKVGVLLHRLAAGLRLCAVHAGVSAGEPAAVMFGRKAFPPQGGRCHRRRR